jgi:phosphatidylglycerophosphatase A
VSGDAVNSVILGRKPADVWRHPVHFLAFGFGSGLVPFAPGTMGTLVALPLFWFLQPLGTPAYVAALVVLFVVGIPLCERTTRALGVHDHPAIVWDEIVGYLLTMLLAPEGWGWVLVGFVLFRLFDIVKPFPIGWVDRRVRGGLGIMLDEVIAALFAWVSLQALATLWA